MKYKICSYQLQDGRWGPAFLPPQGPDVFSERTEFDVYFDTKDEADKYALDHLQSRGFNKDSIEIK